MYAIQLKLMKMIMKIGYDYEICLLCIGYIIYYNVMDNTSLRIIKKIF